MRTRLQQLIEKENISPARFAEIVGVQRSSVSHILSGRNNPGLDFIQKILSAFPNVSSDWLITGKGNVYRHPSIKETTLEQTNTRTAALSDLFSTVKDESQADYGLSAPKMPIAPSVSAPEKASSPITEIKDNPKPLLHTEADNKEIERIVVFYSDRTFKEYKPE